VAVNVAPMQLRESGFVDEFLAHLEQGCGPGWGLDVEITESVLHDDCGEEIRKLAVLRGHGVKVAIDDFGTGYSSLHRLATLPVDALKIDRSFVDKLGSPSGNTLVRIIVAMARAFRMTTIGEGVETLAQLEQLRQLGCDQSQGFLHARPQGRQAVAELLRGGAGSLLVPSETRPEPRDGVA
jgi:EAL domain-containing protein (putative c-di-GMP-specific phosphodiesterase class I)